MVPHLVSWVTSYYPTPAMIAVPPHGRVQMRARLDGGRAPGTLAPRSALSSRRGLARGNQNVSRSFVVHSQRERILDAVANLTAARGYAAVGIDDIAEEAAVSLQAFYEHFADKEDALLVAYELGHAKSLAIVKRAYDAAGQVAERSTGGNLGPRSLPGLRAGIRAHRARGGRDGHQAHGRALQRGVSAFAQMLLPGLEEIPRERPRAGRNSRGDRRRRVRALPRLCPTGQGSTATRADGSCHLHRSRAISRRAAGGARGHQANARLSGARLKDAIFTGRWRMPERSR